MSIKIIRSSSVRILAQVMIIIIIPLIQIKMHQMYFSVKPIES